MKLGFNLSRASRASQSREHSRDYDNRSQEPFIERVRKGAAKELDLDCNDEQARGSGQDSSAEHDASAAVAPEDNPKVAASKAISILTKMETEGFCGIESESIYGAAVAMPQIARSAGWPGTLLALVIRIYIFTILNFLLQGFLLSMVGEEQLKWYPFAGQMHLCDFGASIKDCPHAPNCKGPLGTTYTAPRLYGYNIWSTRIFVRDSLKAVFPDKEDELAETVDPGEYGMENYYCRFACLFLFTLSVVDDLSGTYKLAKTLWYVPTDNESWIDYQTPSWAEKADIKEINGIDELELVQFFVAGIPLHWKLINVCFVLIPKFCLWLALVRSGVHYLMETAGIVDVIVNAMALTFVLEMDEMVFQRFSTTLTKHIMSRIADLPIFNTEDEEQETEEQALRRFNDSEVGTARWTKLHLIVPQRFLWVLFIQLLFLWEYYHTNCEQLPDGSRISKKMHLPLGLDYSPLKLMFGIDGAMEHQPFWTMPD
eukprot:TRINITY_DN43329_c0_g1_i1.p1 TRINITY_DN43329_c0_g1~~TRINITY_DN43329_c0_g1_i1.p1  ORF type:complete len:485 (-),score=80.04 TRINITY_DN43329_c0_g1_i1:106-1560(-)